MIGPWLFTTLTTDVPLSTFLPADSIKAAGSVTSPPAIRPFLMIRGVTDLPAIRDDGQVRASRANVQFWAYDDEGTYDRINAILRRIESIMSGPVLSDDEVHYANWDGLGPELFDDQFKALTRWGSATLTLGRP